MHKTMMKVSRQKDAGPRGSAVLKVRHTVGVLLKTRGALYSITTASIRVKTHSSAGCLNHASVRPAITASESHCPSWPLARKHMSLTRVPPIPCLHPSSDTPTYVRHNY